MYDTMGVLGQFGTRTIWHRGQFGTKSVNGQFGTADNLAPRTIWHHGQFGTAIKFDKFDNVVQSIHP